MHQVLQPLSQEVKDAWFERLIFHSGHASLAERKRTVKNEVDGAYLPVISAVAANRTRLVEQLAQLQRSLGLAESNLQNQGAAIKELDSVIDGVAGLVIDLVGIAKLAGSALRLGAAARTAQGRKVLTRVPSQYYPGINTFKASIHPTDRHVLRSTAREVARDGASLVGETALKHLVQIFDEIQRPSFWSRKALGQSPESAIREQKAQLQRTRTNTESLVRDRIHQLDLAINKLQADRAGLKNYIDRAS